MHTETAEKLCEITSDFYRKHCDSFSATRQAPWNGWKRCLAMVGELAGTCDGAPACEASGGSGSGDTPGRKANGDGNGPALAVFDLACGNLRFESFLAESLPEVSFSFYAVDNCDELVAAEGFADDSAHAGSCVAAGAVGSNFFDFQSLDAIRVLLGGGCLSDRLSAPTCDLSVSFGFMHHVPSAEYREAVLAALIGQTRPGGLVIVSFWQFMSNEKLAAKAVSTHACALADLGLSELDEGDYLLGWKNIPSAYRYCHNFSKSEIDRMVESVADQAVLLARFSADGRTDDLNTYLVFGVR